MSMAVSRADRRGVTVKAVFLGLLLIPAVVLWIHWAEIVMGVKQGHSALASTSIPLGPFFALLCVMLLNRLIGLVFKDILSPREILLIYIMLTTGTVIASSGGMHFLIPALSTPFYYATLTNQWARFHEFIKPWVALKDVPRPALVGFYRGDMAAPVIYWVKPFLFWWAFLTLYLLCTLFLVSLLRRRWIEEEKLTFPTVVVPAEVVLNQRSLFRNRAFLTGAVIPFIIGTVNTFHLNFPILPLIQVRAIPIHHFFTEPPWSAMGYLALSFYPFVIGIAYLLTLDVVLSCWFFYLLIKAQRVGGYGLGWVQIGAGGEADQFPFIGHQGAGAFLALVVITLWVGRSYFKRLFKEAFQGGSAGSKGEPISHSLSLLGFLFSFGLMVSMCWLAGMRLWVAALLLLLALAYILAATRIRAEAGNAWLCGPFIDPGKLLTSVLPPALFTPSDLTAMAFFRTITTFELRCIPTPHQLDALKLAQVGELEERRTLMAIVAGTVLGVAVAFWLAVGVWYRVGAEVEGERWRLHMGREAFVELDNLLRQKEMLGDLGPLGALGYAWGEGHLGFILGGFAFTVLLALARARIPWWPLHPVGYAMANTLTMSLIWVPFFIAWAIKAAVLRYGGHAIYRRTVPFFIGLVVGDFISGGLWTLMGCFFPNFKVYPINW